jgi:hypothetical protein
MAWRLEEASTAEASTYFGFVQAARFAGESAQLSEAISAPAWLVDIHLKRLADLCRPPVFVRTPELHPGAGWD